MILWLTGVTSAGKTWLGDFLQHYHGYVHIDGDQHMAVYSAEKSDVTKNIFRAFYEYWLQEKEAPLELWRPYFQMFIDKAVEQYRKSPDTDIVITFSTYPRTARDFARAEIKRATGQDLTMILLSMSIDDYARRQKNKLVEWAAAHKQTIEEVWNSHFEDKGEYSEEKLDATYREAKEFRGLEPIQADEENSYTVSTDNFHVDVVPEVTRILKLRECPNLDNDVIKKIRSDRLEGYAKLKEELKEKEEKEGK